MARLNFKPGWHKRLIPALAIPLGIVVAIRLLNAFTARPARLGVENGRLTSCPDRPNCVNSLSDDPGSAVEPFHFHGTVEAARRHLVGTLASLPRTRVVSERKDYLHFECTSFVFGFVDDVEFLFVDEGKLVHIRSAARIGYSDLKVNRKRVELIRAKLGW